MNLIECLMAFIVAYFEGNYPNKRLNAILSPKARKVLLENIPGLAPALASYDAGEELDWAEMAQAVKDFAEEYARRPSSKSSFHKALLVFSKYFRTGNEGALKEIRKMSARVDSQDLRVFFSAESKDQKAIVKSLVPIVKKLGGDAGASGLTQDQAKEAKLANPELYREYLNLRKEFNDAWKIELSNFVRASGASTVPFQSVLKHFKANGIVHNMPLGFTGNIDAIGGWYAPDGQPVNGGAPSSVMFPTVRMNPDYPNTPWVFQAIRTTGEPANYFYTAEFVKNQALKKFKKVANFDVEKTRARWLGKVKSFDPTDAASVACLVLEILYRTSNRIGSRIGGNATGGGFGICTLLVSHVKPQPDGSVKFIYLGKDDVKTTALIKKTDDPIAARICAAVNKLIEGKRPKDPVFTVTLGNGNTKQLQPTMVNAVFRKCAGDPDLTVHKLRTAKGTALFNEFLETVYKKYKTLDAKQAMAVLKQGGTIVGKQLNHVRRSAEGETTVQPMTSLKNYIDVGAQIAFFTHYRLPVPSQLEKWVESATVVMCSKLTAAAEESDPDKKDEDVAQEDGVIDEEEIMSVDEAQDLDLPSKHALEMMLTEDPESIADEGDSNWG